MSPPRLFKSDLSLYFPNLNGETLASQKRLEDTTPLLENKVTIVNIFSGQYAKNQTDTFTSAKQNPELHELIKSSVGRVQIVNVNVEYDWLKGMVLGFVKGSLRRKAGTIESQRYFLLWKDLPSDVKEQIGVLNNKIGYTYLVDGDCKIRWASSGNCEPEEKESLLKGVGRLLEDLKVAKHNPEAAHRPSVQSAIAVPKNVQKPAKAVA